MMDWIDFIRWAHVLGACVLIGTGAGIAFFMLMAHRSGNADFIARTAGVVVTADMVFTATAAVAQPVTGLLLAWDLGWPLSEGWVLLSLMLYGVIGAFWLPVVVIQIRMRNLAAESASKGKDLCPHYHRLFRIWFACGVPAFVSILIILWLMLARPDIGFG